MTDATCTVEDCDRPVRRRGWCDAHLMRWRRHGDPQGVRAVLNGTHQKFYVANLMVVTDDCKVWPYNLTRGGYPVMKWEGRRRLVHALACAAWHGPAPDGRPEAAHGPCHNRACWNGQHLSWKSRAENAADMLRDGTHPRGETNAFSRLTEPEVIEIRRLHASGMRRGLIAARFGVHHNTIDVIVRRLAWRHVP